MLGSLEKQVLAVLHKERKATARDVQNTLRERGADVTYVTVNTVLARLFKKGLVGRIQEPYRGRFRYTYQYVELKDQLIADHLDEVDLLLGEEGIEHLKETLKDRESAPPEGEPSPQMPQTTPQSAPRPENLRVRLSVKDVRSPLVKKLEEISGQKVLACYQCGKCSAGCPMVDSMDMLPNQVIRLVQMGLLDELLESRTIWLCASCYSCASRCPKGVDLARLMEGLRLLILRKGENYVEPYDIEIGEELPQVALVCNFRKMTG